MCENGLESCGINAHSGKEYIPLLCNCLIYSPSPLSCRSEKTVHNYALEQNKVQYNWYCTHFQKSQKNQNCVHWLTKQGYIFLPRMSIYSTTFKSIPTHLYALNQHFKFKIHQKDHFRHLPHFIPLTTIFTWKNHLKRDHVKRKVNNFFFFSTTAKNYSTSFVHK